MRVNRSFGYLVVGLALVAAVRAWKERPIDQVPGVLVPQEPLQQSLSAPALPISFNGEQLKPLARYSISARLLAKDRYRFDRGAEYAPWDLALGWQEMSDSSVLEALSISQSSRFYFVSWSKSPPPIPSKRIFETSANVHVIPANSVVDDTIAAARVGQVLQLEGVLVELNSSTGFRWKSSLTRADTGNGACELMYVERVVIQP